ncbi:cold-shock protein [Pseudofulvibacter geojedonensis]|uniref:Cold-shock protein n=1 Tax=Pseudofulvibacter geojedonensis TaxID=1123758 RepID=A0ABW3I4T1_9FLAO
MKKKGYGFIKDNESNNQIFAHESETIETLKVNDKVSFFIKKDLKELNAAKVRVCI